jgi:hypothetical protein
MTRPLTRTERLSVLALALWSGSWLVLGLYDAIWGLLR